MKENLHFQQSRLNYTNNQKQKQKKDTVIVSIGVDVVARTNEEIYVLSIIKIYSFHFFFCCAKEGRVVENIDSDVATLNHHADIVDKKRINFLVSPYCTLLFSRKKNYQVF